MMTCLLKRILPFLLTFSFGAVVGSIFTRPNVAPQPKFVLRSDGNSYGSGYGCAMRYAHRVYDPEDVDVQAQIVSRPEPMYTEEARLNRVTGQVTLRAVLTDRGQVEGIQVVKDLTDGLTDRAEDAARQIEFVPAMKNGRPVSQRILITYNFDLD